MPALEDGDTVLADSFAILMVGHLQLPASWSWLQTSFLIIVSFLLSKMSLVLNFHLQYLEEKYPQNPLLPEDTHKRAINYQVKLFE